MQYKPMAIKITNINKAGKIIPIVYFEKILIFTLLFSLNKWIIYIYAIYWSHGILSLRERLRTHKIFTKDHFFTFNYHKFSIKSYVLDVY